MCSSESNLRGEEEASRGPCQQLKKPILEGCEMREFLGGIVREWYFPNEGSLVCPLTDLVRFVIIREWKNFLRSA